MKNTTTLVAITVSVLASMHGNANVKQSSAQGPSELAKAYQSEILYLVNYKKSISQKIAALKQNQIQTLQQAKRSLNNIESKLLQAQLRNNDLEKRLSRIEERNGDLLTSRNLLLQILEQSGVAEPQNSKGEELQNALTNIFSERLATLEKANQGIVSKADFFDINGQQRKGEILSLGQVAKIGLLADKAGPLVPVGEGKFKIDRYLSTKEFTELKAGKLSTLPVFLFEDANKSIVKEESKSWYATVQSGGAIAWIIVLLGIAGFFLCLVRLAVLYNADPLKSRKWNTIHSLVKAGELEKAMQIANKEKGAVYSLVLRIVANMKMAKNTVEEVVSECLIQETQKIDRFSTIILVIASIAPLLGLLGTVTGIIATFDSITRYGTGNPRLLSGGISEALVTTMLGLIVAIAVMLVGQSLAAWGSKIKLRLEQFALEVFNSFSETENKLSKEAEA